MIVRVTKDQLKIFQVAAIFLAATLFLLVYISSPKSGPAPETCLPAFRDGGGPYYQSNSPFRSNIAPDDTSGQKLIVEGYVYDSDCSDTVSGAIIDIWQANDSGEYEDEYFRGQITTNETGYYRFETVIPLGYGEGTAYRPPHIHFKVHIDGREIVTSQMFFDDVRGRTGFNDEYIITLTETGEKLEGQHNIVLPEFEIN